jgi:hypothetical protein
MGGSRHIKYAYLTKIKEILQIKNEDGQFKRKKYSGQMIQISTALQRTGKPSISMRRGVQFSLVIGKFQLKS